jgi:hypothetical protein
MQEEPFKIVKDSPPSTVTSRYKWLSAINESRESIKNREYFLEFEAKFEKPSDTEEIHSLGGTISEKNQMQKFRRTVPFSLPPSRLVDKTFYTKNSIFMPQRHFEKNV